MQSVTPPPFPKIKLKELNMYLKCILCGGYYIDATTIIECLHSFCKTCIVKYLQTHKFCPICDVQIHKTRPLINIRSDQTLQDIVYKAVPGLFKSEMKRRREFFSKHPDANGMGVPTSSEGRGEVLGGERLIFTPEDYINISLESCPPNVPFPPHGNLISTLNDWPGNNRRYFRCPGSLTVAHLKKLLRNKYGLNPNCKIDVSYVHDYLDESYTMIDLAYIYSWRRNGDLRLFYQTEHDLMLKRRRIEHSLTSTEEVTEIDVNNHPETLKEQTEKVLDGKGNKNHEETVANGEQPLSRSDEGVSTKDGIEKPTLSDNKRETEKKSNEEEEMAKVKGEEKKVNVSEMENSPKETSCNPQDVSSSKITKDNFTKKTPPPLPPQFSSPPPQRIGVEIQPKSNGSSSPITKHNGLIIPPENTHHQRPLAAAPPKDNNNKRSPILANKNVIVSNFTPPIPDHLQHMFATANPHSLAHYHQLQQQHQLHLQQQQERVRLSPNKAKTPNDQQNLQQTTTTLPPRNIQPCPPNMAPLNLRVNAGGTAQQSPQAIAPLHALPPIPALTPVRGIQPKPPRGRKTPQRRRTVKLLQGHVGHTVQQQLQHQQQKQQQLHAQQQQQQQQQQQHYHNLMVHSAQVQQIQQAMLAGQFFGQARLPMGPFRHNEHLNLSIAQNLTDNLQQQQQRIAAFNAERNSHSLPPRHRLPLPMELSNAQTIPTQTTTTTTTSSSSSIASSSENHSSTNQSSPSSTNQTPNYINKISKSVVNSLSPNVTVSFSNANNSSTQVPTSTPVCLTNTTTPSSSSTAVNSSTTSSSTHNNNNNSITTTTAVSSNQTTTTTTTSTTSTCNKSSENSPPSTAAVKSPVKLSRVANYLAKWQPECEPTSPEAYDIPNPLNNTAGTNLGLVDKNGKEKDTVVPVNNNNETLTKSKS